MCFNIGMELHELPVIGDPELVYAYEIGEALDEIFPGESAVDLMYACQHNDWGPLVGRKIVLLTCIQEGENDGPDWIWLLTLDDLSEWRAEGGCDYTGWDCQSSLTWENLDEFVEEEIEDDSEVIRAKWSMDGAKTLKEAAEMLRSFAQYVEDLESDGYQLVDPVSDDYGFYRKIG
jgi:hypothetical protein